MNPSPGELHVPAEEPYQGVGQCEGVHGAELHAVHGGHSGAAQGHVQCMASLGGTSMGGLQERKAGDGEYLLFVMLDLHFLSGLN